MAAGGLLALVCAALPLTGGMIAGVTASTSQPSPAPGAVQCDGGAPAVPVAAANFALPAPGSPVNLAAKTKAAPIPANVQKAYEAAGRKYRIPWQLLAGIGMEETGHNAATAVSSAGAMGPMQFMPATWAEMGVDGNGDGRADIMNVEDAVFSTANMLVKSGARSGPEGVKKAIFDYNHAQWYVNDILTYAHAYASGNVQVDVGSDAGAQECGMADPTSSATVPGGSAAFQAVFEAGKKYLGMDYSWGGGHKTGPSYGRDYGSSTFGFDCSGLIEYMFYKGTGGKVFLEKPATHQYAVTAKHQVPRNALKPGDILFYGSPGNAHHVTMYVGDGKMIESPKTGDVVKISKVRTNFFAATRVLV